MHLLVYPIPSKGILFSSFNLSPPQRRYMGDVMPTNLSLYKSSSLYDERSTVRACWSSSRFLRN